MPITTRGAARQQAAQQAAGARLPPQLYALHAAALPLLAAMFLAGLAGFVVVMGAWPSGSLWANRGGHGPTHPRMSVAGAADYLHTTGQRHAARPLNSLPALAAQHTDREGKYALSHSAFAEHWRWLIGKNPFVQPFSVNFGAIGARCALSRGMCLRINPAIMCCTHNGFCRPSSRLLTNILCTVPAPQISRRWLLRRQADWPPPGSAAAAGSRQGPQSPVTSQRWRWTPILPCLRRCHVY